MIEVCVLGPIAVRVDGAVVAIASRAQRTILAALARDAGRVVAADRMMALVWNDDLPAQPLVSLRSHVSRLRSTLTADVITADHGGYALTLDCEHVDACRFDRQVERAASLTDIDVALDLWRGHPFGHLTDDPFFAADTARLREVHTQALERRAAMLLDASRPDEAVTELHALVADHRFREPAWVLLVRALHRAGRQAEAVAAAGRYRQLMTTEGLEPSPVFRAVEEEIFHTPPARTTARPPERLASIVGRDDELRGIVELLERRRFVTLVGPGGVGKTTLAREAVRRVDLDDVWVAQLAEVDAGGSVIAAVARATGASKTEPLEGSVRAHLTGRAGLVLLDNAEHVLSATADAARLIAGAGPELRLLVTSRQPLGVDGEVVVDVEPLAGRDAVTLFRERAADAGRPVADADTGDVGGLCDRLDRLPLAIEMAAARLRSLPLTTLTSRLDDRLRLLYRREGAGDRRHRTLWEVVDWSYELLDDAQRELFVQLSVFAGSFALDAAEAVCALPGRTDVTLGDLVERSLVRFDPRAERYELLETIRQYAAERRGPDHPVLSRHVDHHVRLAEQIGQGLRGPDDTAWAARFDAHAADIEVAHRRALSTGDADAVARISAALYVLVYQRLRADVGAWAEAGLPLVAEVAHPLEPAVRAVVGLNLVNRDEPDAAADLLGDLPDQPPARYGHEVLADLCTSRGDLVAALDHGRREEDLAQQAGDTFSVAFARVTQAIIHGYAGESATALARATRGVTEADTPLIRAWFDYSIAELRADSDPAEALALLDRVVDQATEAGWEFLLGVALTTAGTVQARHADADEALRSFARLIRHWQRLGDVTHQWTTLRNLVDLLVRVGAHEQAGELLGAVSQTPTPTYGSELRRLRAASEQLQDALGDDRFETLYARGTQLDRADVEALALQAIATWP